MILIKTKHEYPPIPYRGNDWCAWYEGEEEYGNYGWGHTREEAIEDLKLNYEPGEDLHEWEPDYNAPTFRESYERAWEEKRRLG